MVSSIGVEGGWADLRVHGEAAHGGLKVCRGAQAAAAALVTVVSPGEGDASCTGAHS